MEKHIRHSKTQNGKHSKTKQSAAITAIVVILSIVLISLTIYLSPLGTLIQKHIVEPVKRVLEIDRADESIEAALKSQDETIVTASPTAEETNSPQQTTVLHIQETPFYLLQMGTYLDEKQAEERAEQILTMGAGGVVWKDEAVYRVFAAAYRDEDSLKQVQSQVRADGFEATPYITETNTLTITLQGEEDALRQAKEAIDFLSTIPENLSDMSLSFDRKQIDNDDVIEEMTKMSEKALTIINTLEQNQNDSLKPVLNVVQKYLDNISTFLEEHDNISLNEISGALKHLQIKSIMDYIQFFEWK